MGIALMIGHVIAFACIFVGTCGLLLVIFLTIHSKFQKRYIVRWRDIRGAGGWTLLSACTVWGAIKQVKRTEQDVGEIIKVVRQW